ncbi:MAG: ATP-binding protein [Pseudomonadota bacterium]
MNIGLRTRLTAVMVAVTALVLAATLALSQWSFDRGLLTYINALEEERLGRLAMLIAQRESTASLATLSEAGFAELVKNGSAPRPRQSESGARPHSPREGPRGGRPPPKRPPPGAPPGPSGPLPSTALLDRSGQIQLGELPTTSTPLVRVPLIIDGESMGELVSSPLALLGSSAGTAFVQEHQRAMLLIGVGSVLATSVIAVLLAGWLLAPIRRTIAAVARLSEGHYGDRLTSLRHDELGDLMRDLDRLADTLAANRDHRRRWFADISHELRTPLTVLRGELEALQDGVREATPESLTSLLEEARALNTLIDDLYELSVADLGGLRYAFATLDLGELVSDATAGMMPLADARGLTLSCHTQHGPLTCTGDATRLTQLVRNLVGNAITYTHAPGEIQLTVTRKSDDLILSIDDTPPGVAEADLAQLFEPLWRGEASRSRQHGGAGLGLAIVQYIVAAHGGNVGASTSGLGGLQVTITLPAGDSQ